MFILGHSEYWSFDEYEHLRQYLESGGNVIFLSGNTMFWRVSDDSNASVMECRKTDGWGVQLRPEFRGECWHSEDRKRGGVLRECGFPAWQLIGVEFMSYNPLGMAGTGPFRATKPDHFLFQKPHHLNLKKGNRFGFDPHNPKRQVVEDEGDVRVSTLMKTMAGPVPDGAPTDLKDPPGIEMIAQGFYDWSQVEERAFHHDYYHRRVPHERGKQQDVAYEMIYWEHLTVAACLALQPFQPAGP